MAMHTQNLQADPRASLFVTEPDASGDPLGSSRVTLIGSVIRLAEPELAAARTAYLTGYPDSRYWVDFDDFFFYRMDVVDLYYVGGFGVMGWVAASEYSQAQPDPLVESKNDIIRHMNADHKDALILLAKRFAGIEAQEANMTAVDRLGFHVRLKTQDGVIGSAFPGFCSTAWYSCPSTLNAAVLRCCRVVLRTGAERPSTATVVPAISCEATDFNSSASRIGKYAARNSSL
jgi:hypothetical protein